MLKGRVTRGLKVTEVIHKEPDPHLFLIPSDLTPLPTDCPGKLI
jgi:hypothetical protein